MVSTIKVSSYISLKYVQIVRKQSVTSETTTAKRLISIMIKVYAIWWNLHGSVLCVWQNNNKLCGLQAQSIVYTTERLEEEIQDDV